MRASALLLVAIAAPAQAAPLVHVFKKRQLDTHFWAEGATFGDLNRDGKADLIAGPYWWEGPAFKKRHEYYPATQTFPLTKPDGTTETIPGFEGGLGVKNAYSDNFFAFVRDFNGDGWNDILIIGFPGKDTSWFENPRGKEIAWQRHLALAITDNESPTFADLTGDGVPEIVSASGGSYGYATPDPADPGKPWTFHAITPNNKYGNFVHGLGVGDVNGDGRMDLLEKDGWWEQPASLAGDPLWTRHAFRFAGRGGAQMYAYDVNGDGRNDVITVLEAHGHGLSWFENTGPKDGELSFTEHVIIGRTPADNRYGLKISQMHAVALIDMDGDGLLDLVTGKRYWAHGKTGDSDPGEPPLLYWLRLVRNPDRSVDFVPHKIDDDSGVGTQLVVADFNRDRLPDLVVANKKGIFLFEHGTRKVTQRGWLAAQPKPTQ